MQDYEEDFEEELESSSESPEEEEEEEDKKRGVSNVTREVKGREKMDLMEIMQAIDAENQIVGPALTGSGHVGNSQEQQQAEQAGQYRLHELLEVSFPNHYLVCSFLLMQSCEYLPGFIFW